MNAQTRTGIHAWTVAAAMAAGLCLATPLAAQDTDDDVQITDYGTVDMAVQDTDLAQVLEMLAIQSRKNIIAGDDVSATVTANLYDVTFYEALDSVLRVNGYGYLEEGNFIYIYTLEELAEIESAMRLTESRVYELFYLAAEDASEAISPLLSEAGTSSYVGATTSGFMPDVNDGGGDSYAFAAKIVVNDYPENLDLIAELLQGIDMAPDQVMVEATIIETAVAEANAFGVDFSLLGSLDFTDLFAGPLGAVNEIVTGITQTNQAQAVSSTVGGTRGPAGFKVGIVQDNIAVFLRLLDEVSDVTVLARPKVLCLNRQRAEILVGKRVGYLSTTQTDTTTTQTVEYLDTGIHLTFRPFISPDDMVRLELYPRVSEATPQSVTDVNQNQVTIPDEITQEMITNVRVRSGETVILGGLFREKTRIKRSQVPGLGDIPGLGLAFRGQDDEVRREEIIFMITPTVTEDEILYELGEAGQDTYESVRLGARAGLLPFSRDQVTANYNQDAIKAYRDGDEEMALYYANASLRMNSNQTEMIRLRQELTGKKDMAYDHNVMHRLINKEMQWDYAGGYDAGSDSVPQTDNDSGIVPDNSTPTTAPAGSQGVYTPNADWESEPVETASNGDTAWTTSDDQWTSTGTGSWSTTLHDGPTGLQLIPFWEWASWENLTSPTSTHQDSPAFAGVTDED